jgi:acetaldehyde dehydrogenase (acetylating)
MGHTMSIHSQNDQVILEFGLKKPAFRIVVNSPTTHGSIGLTTGLDPAMTLGCGGYGGNITSDNISPRHLLNIKRVAYEITPAVSRFERSTAAEKQPVPRSAPQPGAAGISSTALAVRIEQFLAGRGFKPSSAIATPPPSARLETGPPLDFVCEEDVRLALRTGRTLLVSERAIVTPAARDLGEEHRVFTIARINPGSPERV